MVQSISHALGSCFFACEARTTALYSTFQNLLHNDMETIFRLNRLFRWVLVNGKTVEENWNTFRIISRADSVVECGNQIPYHRNDDLTAWLSKFRIWSWFQPDKRVNFEFWDYSHRIIITMYEKIMKSVLKIFYPDWVDWYVQAAAIGARAVSHLREAKSAWLFKHRYEDWNLNIYESSVSALNRFKIIDKLIVGYCSTCYVVY